MIGTALKEARTELRWPQRVVGLIAKVSESMVKEWEHDRRPMADEHKRRLSRGMNSGRLCMALKNWVTGGIAAPYLDGANVDTHRLVMVERTIEEMREAIAALEGVKSILLKPPDRTTAEERQLVMDRLLEVIEADTAAENALARVAREYGLSLADLYDRHQEELIDKGFLEKEKGPQKRAAI